MIWSIARKEIKLLMKEKGTYFWLFIMPIIFIVLFASIFGNLGSSDMQIGYVDQDQSPVTQKIIQEIGAIKGFELKDQADVSVEEQIAKIRDGKQTTLVVFPKGFSEQMQAGSKPAEVLLYHDGMSDSVISPINAVLQNIFSQYQQEKVTSALMESGKQEAEVKQILTPSMVVTSKEERNGEAIDMVTQVVPGYTVMFVFYIMISMIQRFLKDRESGMISRLGSTPMQPIKYLIGMWIPYVFAVLIQSSVLLAFGRIVYGMHLGDIFALLCVVIVLALCGTALGLVLCLYAKSENQGIAYTQIIALGGAILGGLWFPLQLMPQFIQTIAKFTPQYWAQNGLQTIILRGGNITDVWLNVLILLGVSAVALVIALYRYPRFLMKAVD